MSHPIVWTIAGSDSGGGAGIQTDLHTFHAFGVHGCSVITALTAQNTIAVSRIEFTSNDMIKAQIESLANDLPARAIKMGMLGSEEVLKTILPWLKKCSVPIIYDPVLFATVGDALHQGEIREFLLTQFIPHITLLTPNIPEAEWLLNKSIQSNDDIECAAKELLSLGIKNVLIKGGHVSFQGEHCQDYFASPEQQYWFTNKRHRPSNHHGTGCTLASAITACLALHYSLIDAVVIAKAYVSQGIRLAKSIGKGPKPISHHYFPTEQIDFPLMTKERILPITTPFAACDKIGFYPIVDSVEWVKKLISLNVKTIQLRIKNISKEKLIEQMKLSIELAREHHITLFINDYWELAIELGAYGVHLGQEDLDQANLMQIQQAGLRLGISTHSDSEIARARAYQPSYIAIGPIYSTTSKIMSSAPQGLEKLHRYRKIFDCPMVAIGGITLERLPDILQTGVNGVAVISAITKSDHPDDEIRKWLLRIP
jgi:hydroxymethylpyrimidine kinase/phosphomethylpyrimidine kinase/thiamine-phosphate diphosphorylase